MYKKYKGLLQIAAPVYVLKNYLNPGLDPDQKDVFVRTLVLKELKAHKHKKLGFFLGLKDYTLNFIKVSPYDNNMLEVSCFFEAYYYSVDQGELLLGRVTKISVFGLEVTLHNPYLVAEIGSKNLSVEPVIHIPALKMFGLKNNERLKENDVIKLKVTNLINQTAISPEHPKFRISASCANKGLGRL